MSIHDPDTIRAMRPPGKYPQIYITSPDKKNINIEFCYKKAMSGDLIKLTRHQAKILAEKIFQHLSETNKSDV